MVITKGRRPSDGSSPPRGDSWSNWDPDPERAFREHDPGREPYASMPRAEILARMQEAKGGREWEFLREYLLDRCAREELNPAAFQAMLEGAMGPEYEEFSLLFEDAGPATRLRGADPTIVPAWSTGMSGPVSHYPRRFLDG